jgi:hypothetical protein
MMQSEFTGADVSDDKVHTELLAACESKVPISTPLLKEIKFTYRKPTYTAGTVYQDAAFLWLTFR